MSLLAFVGIAEIIPLFVFAGIVFAIWSVLSMISSRNSRSLERLARLSRPQSPRVGRAFFPGTDLGFMTTATPMTTGITTITKFRRRLSW